MLDIGSVIDGKYKILDVIGKGGMSVVYQARNERANKIWAIKEIRKDGMQNYEVVRQNLIAETDMLKKLNHPNLPSIVDVIDREGTFLIVMDYIQGKPLSDVLKASGAQPQDDVIEWSKQLCDVLGYLHSRNPAIIYRDMKPSNVMLKPDNNIALIDFGTAREFKSSSVADTTCLGTRGYAAPEQFGGQGQTDARTDIYCLGATMYHLVTGHNPATPPYEMYPIRQWNPLLSSGLEQIILKCTQLNPNDRYQSCAELLYALDNIQYLEEESRKSQKTKWNIFWTSVALTGVMGVGALGFNFANTTLRAQNYQELLDKTRVAIEDYQMTDNDLTKRKEYREYLQKTIECDDSRVEAFEELLNSYFKDASLEGATLTYNKNENNKTTDSETRAYDLEEYQEFKDVTGSYFTDSNAGKYYNETFADKIFLPLGTNLFLNCSNKQEGLNSSLEWLDKAKEYCSEDNKTTASALYDVASYYKMVSARASVDMTTGKTQSVDYAKYWLALETAEANARYENKEHGASVLLVEVCRLVSSEVVNRADRFKAAGVEASNVAKLLDNIEEDLKLLETTLQFDNVSDFGKRVTDAKVSLGKARQQITETYGRNDQAGDSE